MNRPIGSFDLLGLEVMEAGVEVWAIPHPHMWIRIPDENFSIGLYPEDDNVLLTRGKIQSPDDVHESDEGAGPNRKIKLDCDKYDFEKFKDYIKEQVNAKPPIYCVLIGNCGDWVTDVIAAATIYAEKK